jgi:hypothetical protein
MSDLDAPSTAQRGAGAVVGLVLIGLGLLFFVAQFFTVDLGHYLWPFFVIIPGLAFFAAMVLGGRKASGLAVPGSIITTVGLLLFYQNISDHWESWAYAWALIPTAVGIGLVIHGTFGDRPSVRASGRRLALVGIVLFLVFGAFFEAVLNISGIWALGQWLWPILLILVGLLMLARNLFRADR